MKQEAAIASVLRARRPAGFVLTLALLGLAGCMPAMRPHGAATVPIREFNGAIVLHGRSLKLHFSKPESPTTPPVVVLYATGDGGWFGAAVDMFQQIARAGYNTVGFSSRAFLSIERPRGSMTKAADVASEYGEILSEARRALQIEPATPVVLTGWSRGAALAVLVGSEPSAHRDLQGVVAIGLGQGEDLRVDAADAATDDGDASDTRRPMLFDNYQRTLGIAPLPCVVIQATHDGYLPAAQAQQSFGADTPLRRFYAIEATNHRFSHGKPAFDAALLDALGWIASTDKRPPQS